jgi:hypothetical protein
VGEALTFVAEIYKVQTLVDRGLRVTLDLPEDAVVEVAKLMEYRRQGIGVQVTIEPEE